MLQQDLSPAHFPTFLYWLVLDIGVSPPLLPEVVLMFLSSGESPADEDEEDRGEAAEEQSPLEEDIFGVEVLLAAAAAAIACMRA